MVFSSPEFIFIFLPISWLIYVGLRRTRFGMMALGSLTFASLVFYGFWRPQDLPILGVSACGNFWLARHIAGSSRLARMLFLLALAFNLGLLFWFKYAAFASQVATELGLLSHPLARKVLPLGISFFTFTQIAYLVDRRGGKAPLTSFGNYLLFVAFFPHLMAGPIIHHAEMMPQFDRPVVSWDNVARGLFVTCIGLAKKVIIADTLASVANEGFAHPGDLALVNAWGAVLAYTFQLYFDFSGYSDMAVGLSLMYGIRLPWNFLSPYKCTNISDFWRHWHVTLSRFLRDYVYIPLGGSRGGRYRTMGNLLITMLLGGIWHGAGWTFVLWGAVHGVALAAYHFTRDWFRPLPAPLGWAVTQGIVLLGWVLFRAESLSTAGTMFARLVTWPQGLAHPDSELVKVGPFLVVAAALAIFAPNTAEWEQRFRPTWRWGLAGGVVGAVAALFLLGQLVTPEFLYYDF